MILLSANSRRSLTLSAHHLQKMAKIAVLSQNIFLTVQNRPFKAPNSRDIEFLMFNSLFSYTDCPLKYFWFRIFPFENPLLEHKTQDSISADFSYTTTLKPKKPTFEGPGKP